MLERCWTLLVVLGIPVVTEVRAEQPLHARVDALILARAEGQPASAVADDAEFLRRVYLDFTGAVPTAGEARAFLADKAPDKRARLIDRLLNGPEYPRRMQEAFHVLLMERLGDHPEWARYLRTAFEKNKPWDVMTREMLAGTPQDPSARGAAFFLTKRLENYGQNPVDYPALTRDVGRLFLGMNLQCAECHDHLFVDDYKQEDFKGLHAFFQNTFLANANNLVVGEKPTLQKMEFASVFKKVKKQTGPRVPGLKEVAIPALKKGEEYLEPPDRKKNTPGVLKFSPLARLAEQLPTPDNAAFNRNGANRLWFLLMGRGLVHPLDLHHSDNPPSHPELLELLAKEFVAHKYDIRWYFRELALSQTYQRSGVLPPGVEQRPAETFLTANEKRLGAEQLLASVLIATGEHDRLTKDTAALTKLREKFFKAFANAAREPEDEIAPSLKAALFVMNDAAVLDLLTPRPGNLVDRLTKLTDPDQVAEELYLSVLTRLPDPEEKALVAAALKKHADRRPIALGQLAWALLASTEFGVNH